MAGVQASLPSPRDEGVSFLLMLCRIKDKLMGHGVTRWWVCHTSLLLLLKFRIHIIENAAQLDLFDSLASHFLGAGNGRLGPVTRLKRQPSHGMWDRSKESVSIPTLAGPQSEEVWPLDPRDLQATDRQAERKERSMRLVVLADTSFEFHLPTKAVL